MRLIDADELEARVINFQGRGKKTFLEMLTSQPTAYDIDKVVEQLEELSKYEVVEKKFEKAIEILKGRQNE